MQHLNDTFAAGANSLSAKLREHASEPEVYTPQHDQAHVRWPREGHCHGYPVCYVQPNRRANVQPAR